MVSVSLGNLEDEQAKVKNSTNIYHFVDKLEEYLNLPPSACAQNVRQMLGWQSTPDFGKTALQSVIKIEDPAAFKKNLEEVISKLRVEARDLATQELESLRKGVDSKIADSRRSAKRSAQQSKPGEQNARVSARAKPAPSHPQ